MVKVNEVRAEEESWHSPFPLFGLGNQRTVFNYSVFVLI